LCIRSEQTSEQKQRFTTTDSSISPRRIPLHCGLWTVGSFEKVVVFVAISAFAKVPAVFTAFISPTTPRKKAAPEPMLPFA